MRFFIGQKLTRKDFTEVLYVVVVGFQRHTFEAVLVFRDGQRADFITECPYREDWKQYLEGRDAQEFIRNVKIAEPRKSRHL